MNQKAQQAKNVIDSAKDFLKDKIHQAKDFFTGKKEEYLGEPEDNFEGGYQANPSAKKTKKVEMKETIEDDAFYTTSL